VTINEKRRGNVGILSLQGSFSGKPGVAVFERAIFDLLRDNVVCIVLDLADLRFIDSAGLGAMISAMVSVGRRDGALKLAALGGDVHKVMTSMHLDQVFELCKTVDEAEAVLVKREKI
jgi:anti-sigma B factor antagonist